MHNLLLHPRNHAELTALLQDAPHALLLLAPDGFGKFTVATTWAQLLAANAAISTLQPDEKGTISIEATRTLYQRTRAKQAGRQVVIVDHADAMSGEAQNAFLKLLEEPRQNVTFILTAASGDALLPTIRSRLQTVQLLPVSASILAKDVVSNQTLSQQLFVAAGRPAIFVTIQKDPNAFETHRVIMQRAKQLLGASQYERLCMVQELSKDRTVATETLEALAHMLQLQIKHTPSVQLLNLADTLQECLRRLRQNGNLRAQLTHLFAAY